MSQLCSTGLGLGVDAEYLSSTGAHNSLQDFTQMGAQPNTFGFHALPELVMAPFESIFSPMSADGPVSMV